MLQEPGSARSGSGSHTGGRLTEGLAHMLDWARAQAGQCVRALRLEMLLLMIYHLQVRLAASGHGSAGLPHEVGSKAGHSYHDAVLGVQHMRW